MKKKIKITFCNNLENIIHIRCSLYNVECRYSISPKVDTMLMKYFGVSINTPAQWLSPLLQIRKRRATSFHFASSSTSI